MTKRTLAVLVGIGVVALAAGSMLATTGTRVRPTAFSVQTLEPVDAQLAAKAEDSCWFKVKSRSGRATEVRQWEAVSSTGAKAERLGELLIVTGAMEPAVRDDHFYGCSLFQYNQGSPVVMSAITSPTPVRPDNVIPFGFSPDGKKQQQ
ncbi:MAG TPA: hypothetical protein VM032_08460 [Vicinamibacterales bacterium]|nr:hypothetical protein [Vicinamibacterales bacterium]